ncbi:ABC transporter ATP-binding protein [Herbaspirillum sp. LeCh32-8]|uniref:ABC transporter ATP-binding protein n=1 Tax=Herbaspirillum sp. LeCh32-8 TaxID=2821356 RepID=UPI001AE957CD|nr:ABC transporter ATP-binding protein [Herbaspirillum sp. LeCh32-8]MBP0598076.1 ABC transporter ATP-binding protein [Herbaspirillum sp. LeCh32-8]
MLEIDDVRVSRGNTCILDGITLRPRAGNLCAVIGPNGSGKSTLLKTIAGQCRPDSGSIRFGAGRYERDEAAQAGERVSFMPQDIRLDLDLSAVELALLGRLPDLRARVDDALLQQALSVLDTVGLLPLANRSIARMSGGQRQMALFAQLLMRSCAVLLLDEPVSALDVRHQVMLLDVLHRETRCRQCTTLVVLHDLNLAVQYADDIVVIDRGRVTAQGKAHEVMTAAFLERTYGIRTDVVAGSDGLPRITPLRGAAPAAPLPWPACPSQNPPPADHP